MTEAAFKKDLLKFAGINANDGTILLKFGGHHHAVQSIEGRVHPVQLVLEVGLTRHLHRHQSGIGARAHARPEDDPNRFHPEATESRA